MYLINRRLIGHAIVAITAACLLPYAADDIARHVRELYGHFKSGSWEITSDQEAVEQHIRNIYGDSSQWAIHFVAGTGRDYPLDIRNREETLQILGRSAAAEVPQLRLKSIDLAREYGGLLAARLNESVVPRRQEEWSALRKLIRVLVPQGGQNVGRQVQEGAPITQASLDLVARQDLLAEALRRFIEHEDPRGLYFREFEVFVEPSYDLDGAWTEAALTLQDQVLKCRGDVAPLDGGTSSNGVGATISLKPRAAELRLIRDWLSDEFLDAALASRGEASRRHFGSGGHLRLIPSRLWVLLGHQVTIRTVSPDDNPRLERWVRAGMCCAVVCSGDAFRVAPQTVGLTAKREFVGYLSDSEPLLYAVLSRRRIFF